MAIGKETYVALLAVTFGLIMVQMQTTVYGQNGNLYGTNRATNNTTNNSTTNNSTTNNSTTNSNNSTNSSNSTKPATNSTGSTGGTGGTGGTSGGSSNGTNSNLSQSYNCTIYNNCTNSVSASALTSSSPVTGWFRLLLHVIMAVSFLQIIQ